MTKISILAALPLIFSLGSVVLPHRNEEYLQVREPRWFAPPPAAAQPQDHVKDPFADLHFE